MTLRPKARGGCQVEGVCPFFGCRHHLLLDVSESGSMLSAGLPHLPPKQGAYFFRVWEDPIIAKLEEAKHTCSLDVADEGEHTLDEIGKILGVTRERVRQIETKALMKLREEGLGTTRRLREGIVGLKRG